METTNPETANGQPLTSNREIAGSTSASRLTLYEIEMELSELLDLREEMTAGAEDTTALDAVIAGYVSRELSKVDGIASYLRHCRLMKDAANEEIARLVARREAWETRAELLKARCVDVMTLTQQKRITGLKNTLVLKGNGGKQPVTIANPELVPDEFCVYEGAIPQFVYDRVFELATKHGDSELVRDLNGLTLKRTPRKSLIEAELQKPCDRCQGNGFIPRNKPEIVPTCEACGGSGKRGVPGCTLEPRGVHLEVK